MTNIVGKIVEATPIVGKISSKAAEANINAHNTSGTAHDDIRTELAQIGLIGKVTVENTKWPSTEVFLTDNVLEITGHGLANDDRVAFVPTGLIYASADFAPPVKVGYAYFVINSATNTFQISESVGGSPVSIPDLGTSEHWQIEKLEVLVLSISGLANTKYKAVFKGGHSSNATLARRQYNVHANIPNVISRHVTQDLQHTITASSITAHGYIKIYSEIDMHTDGKTINMAVRSFFGVISGTPSGMTLEDYINIISTNIQSAAVDAQTEINTVYISSSYPNQFLFDGSTLEVYNV